MIKQICQILLVCLAMQVWGLEIYPLEKVHKGLKGTGITLLEGKTPITFEVEILGIQKAILPNYPIILGRMHHPLLEKTGIVAGMSGSPVTIDGKLLGAIAYGWAFAKEPYCGITPFSIMKKQLPGTTFLDLPAYDTLWQAFMEGSLPSFTKWLETLPSFNPSPSSPPIPLVLQGWQFPEIPSFHNLFVTTPQGGKSNQVFPLKPGYPIAVVLAQGPFPLYASGTLTAKEGNRLYLFGHPFFGGGRLEAPLAYAEPITSIASLFQSFRMSNLGNAIGSTLFDGWGGVTGEWGKIPDTLPLGITINGWKGTYKILRHPFWSALLTALLPNIHLTASPAGSGKGTLGLSLKIFPEGEKVVQVNHRFAGEGDLLDSTAGTIFQVMALVMQNPWKKITLNKVTLALTWEASIHRFTIQDVSVSQGEVSPGEVLSGKLILMDQEGKKQTLPFNLPVPYKPDDTEVDLYLMGGASLSAFLNKYNPPQFKDFSHLAYYLNQLPREDELYGVWVERGKSYMSQSYRIGNPGVRLKTLLKKDLKKVKWDIKPYRLHQLSGPLQGYQHLKIHIKREDLP